MKKSAALFAGLVAVVLFLLAAAPTGLSQSFNMLYSFGAGGDGAQPEAGVTLDRGGNIYGTTVMPGTAAQEPSPYGSVTFDAQGNIYGTASAGGRYGRGVVWEIVP